MYVFPNVSMSFAYLCGYPHRLQGMPTRRIRGSIPRWISPGMEVGQMTLHMRSQAAQPFQRLPG